MFINRTVFAYDDKTTHPAITDEIVDFYNLSFDKKITAEEKERIIQGSILEDTEPRYINHFYDPIYKQGWTGEHSGEWFSKDLMQKFSDVFLSSENGVSALNWAHNQELQEKYKRYQGNRTWEKALYEYVKNKDKKEAFSDLGYILHLLEDMSVPEHTRNDTHPNDSPYENYSQRFTRNNFHIANDLKKQNFQPVNFNNLDEYFEYVANYSNNYFFSKDTVNDPKYEKPKIIKSDSEYGYGLDKDNKKFVLVGVETRRIKEGNEYKDTKVYLLTKDQLYEPILNAYWIRLSREAVLSGSGVIDLFFQEAEKMEKDPSLLQPPPENTSAIFSIYGEITKVINSTVSVVKKVEKTASGILNKITDGWNKDATNQPAAVVQSISENKPAKATPPPVTITNNNQTTIVVEPAPAPSKNENKNALNNVSQPVVSSVPIVNNVVFHRRSGGGGGNGSGDGSAPTPQPESNASPDENPLLPPPPSNPDTTAPVISIAGSNPVDVTKETVYVDAGATAIDETDGAREIVATGIDAVNTSVLGAYTITYTTTDLSNNISTLARTVNVVAPPLPPLNTFTIDKDTILTAGEYNYDNLIITNNATLTLEGNPLSSNSFKGVKINAYNITIDSGATISADGQGYLLGPGTSDDSYENGSSYGGVGGGATAKPVYGSAIEPVDLGSGGVGGHRGGGAIRLVVSGTLKNNGVISANGTSYRTSGGSIYVTTNYLSGEGSFSANGASTSWPYQNSGGGGRIAIYYEDSSFIGPATALAGVYCFSGCNPAAEAGTVGLFDLSDNSLNIFTTWRFQKNDNPFNFSKIILKTNAKSKVEDDVIINADSLLIDEGSSLVLLGNQIFNIPNITIDGGSTLTFSEGETINTDTLLVNGRSTLTFSGSETVTANLLAVTGNSIVTVAPEQIFSLTIPNIAIEAGSSISADAKGYINGPGTLTENYAGGIYGGDDKQNSPPLVYGSAIEPVDLGSGGVGGHHGGGAIRLIVTDTLLNEGLISANGDVNSSGGSVYITAKNITGNGKLSANGGGLYLTSVINAAGGGGRVALYYENSLFTGIAEAKGGCGSYDGWSMTCASNGTVGFFDTVNNNLLVNSSWQFRNIDSPFDFNNIYISDGAKVMSEDGINITTNNILIDNASTFTLSGNEIITADTLTLSGNSIITVIPEQILSLTIPNLNIENGSSISAEKKGYLDGPGTPAENYEAGASYGGMGGGATAKPVYGSITIPVDFGSGTEGRRGGGAIRLIVSNILNNEGIISVNGIYDRVSGGSIYVTANKISGDGFFQANGGNGSWPYGPIGGGGGRIVIHYQTSNFSGTTTALGGIYCFSGCASAAGNGTIEIVDESIVVNPVPEPEPDPNT